MDEDQEKKPLSARQTAHLARVHQIRNEKRIAAAHASAEPELPLPPEEDEEESPLAADELLTQLGQALMASGQSRQERNAKLLELDEVLSTLEIQDYPELAASPVIQRFIEIVSVQKANTRAEDPPGTVYNHGKLNEAKKPWQWRDLPRYFRDPTCRTKGRDCPNCGGQGTCIEMMELTPNETKPLIWNSLSYPIVADEQQWVPRPHYELYIESRRQRRAAEEHARVMFRQADVARIDPTIIGPGTSKVRGSGIGTTAYRAGAGMFNPGEPEGEGAET